MSDEGVSGVTMIDQNGFCILCKTPKMIIKNE